MDKITNTMTVEELVYITPRGNTITDSIKVAAYFGRLHKNIIKSVRRLMNQGLANEFRGIVGDRICYQMTQKGFEAVTKTLPGVDALRQAAIDRFNAKCRLSFSEYAEKNPEQAQVIESSVAVNTSGIAKAIQITNTDAGRFVDARQLHAFINGASAFTTWMKSRIEHCGLVEGEDYVAIDSSNIEENIANIRVGRPSQEYALTVDCAKELCMVEGNEKGRAVRRYFIAAEKQYRAQSQLTAPAIPQTFAQALRLAAEQAETIESQQKQIEAQSKQLAAQESDIKFVQALQTANTSIYIADLAKLICQNGVDIGGIRLFRWMRENGYLTLDNKPTQKALEMGLFEIRTTQWEKPNGEICTSFTTLVTVKGQKYFINKFIYNAQHKP